MGSGHNSTSIPFSAITGRHRACSLSAVLSEPKLTCDWAWVRNSVQGESEHEHNRQLTAKARPYPPDACSAPGRSETWVSTLFGG
jgi:hypothetical protein